MAGMQSVSLTININRYMKYTTPLTIIWLWILTFGVIFIISVIEKNPRCYPSNTLPETFFIENGNQTIAFLGCKVIHNLQAN